jgi:acyl-CoA synthetase (NDP forming)
MAWRAAGWRCGLSRNYLFLLYFLSLVAAALDWAMARGIGLPHFTLLNGAADRDFGDVPEHLARVGVIRAIPLYIPCTSP